MKPSYTFEELRDLIRKANCDKDIQILKFLMRTEGKRYSLIEADKIFRQLRVAERMLS